PAIAASRVSAPCLSISMARAQARRPLELEMTMFLAPAARACPPAAARAALEINKSRRLIIMPPFATLYQACIIKNATTGATVVEPAPEKDSLPGRVGTWQDVRRCSVGKNIVICCDGTGNEFGDSNSNVVKLYHTLVIDNISQVGYYHPGVGTMG